jgi:GNAT superfamily N-acetyltransferase
MTEPANTDHLTLLRLHVAAVWGLRVPPLAPGDNDLPPDATVAAADGASHWELFQAATALGVVRLWRAEVSAAVRPALLARVAAARALPVDAPLPPGITREVALARTAPSRLTLAQARHRARALRPQDGPLFDWFDPGEAAYYSDPHRAPVFGVVRNGRLLAVAHSSRRTCAACELGVATLPEARQRGYALAATVRWAEAVAAEGLVPLYSALATNRASLALAAAAGYRPFAHATYATAP